MRCSLFNRVCLALGFGTSALKLLLGFGSSVSPCGWVSGTLMGSIMRSVFWDGCVAGTVPLESHPSRVSVWPTVVCGMAW